MRLSNRRKWEIHYADLSVYSSLDGPWTNAPTSGVLFVVEFSRRHKEVYMGMDYYYMDPMPSGGIDTYLEVDKDNHLFLPEASIKIGNWTDQDTWNTVHRNIFGV